MELAEIIYHNQQAFVKLPAHFSPSKGCIYIQQNPTTGDVLISQSQKNWDDLWQRIQAIGAVEDLPDFKDREPELFRDPLTS